MGFPGYMAGRWVGGEVRQRKPSKRERERERERVRAKPKRAEGGGSMVAGGSYLDGGEDNGLAGHGASKAKVAELHRAVRSDQNVLRLHVAVDDAV